MNLKMFLALFAGLTALQILIPLVTNQYAGYVWPQTEEQVQLAIFVVPAISALLSGIVATDSKFA